MLDLTNKFLDKVRAKRVTINCVGDAMIDQYHFVNVDRISPEFPMPIMTETDQQSVCRPGGVANVVHQLKFFNCEPILTAILDNCAAEVFFRAGIKMGGSIIADHDPDYARVPIKCRFIHDGIQVNRWDQETADYNLSRESLIKIRKKIKADMPTSDVSIFSDYGKGLFDVDDDFWMKNPNSKVTIVDPKKAPLNRWKACTIFKPNYQESCLLTGLKRCEDQCKFYRDELGCKHVFVTHAGRGVSGSWDGEYFEYRSDGKIEPNSVVGAGDCFVAILGLAVAHGFEGREAAEIAFQAGKLYVQGRMNRPIVPAELSPNKIVQAADLKERNFKLVFTNGCFDILHQGHLHTLREAKALGDKLVVAVNTDESVRALKGTSRPIVPLKHRMAVLAALEMVDFVVPFGEENPIQCIKSCLPDILVKGGDYTKEQVLGRELVGRVEIVPHLPGMSTTKILDRADAAITGILPATAENDQS
jgi:D-beta-D-heptose 7-phosphate kinase/D-beta-D-heptose 1-phosphate adenosyltransferase